MDKYEYKVRSEEISSLINDEKYAEAVKIADTIDWRRVKSSTMLLKISALYRVNKRNEDSRSILMLAYDRYPTNRSVVYSLCELSIELDDVVAAIEFYKQFVKIAPDDSGVYTLRYRILEAQEASLEERIAILEDLKIKDYQEEWVYELAYLYHRVGLATKCVEVCDELILWIGDGPYVMKAMELKSLHVPLTDEQQLKYNFMLRNANGNYSATGYGQDDDAQDNYNDGYNDGNYDNNYGDDNYGNDNYNDDNFDTSYNGENYDENGNYIGDDYNGSYDNGNYDNGNYEAGYNDEYADNGYSNQDYNGENYDAGYDENGDYIGEDYNGEYNGNYDNGNYEAGYNDEYADNGYSNQSYNSGNYGESYDENYDADYDENGNYIGDDFYQEQTFDEYGNPIEDGAADDNASDDGILDENYAYDNAQPDESPVNEAPIKRNDVDMSQYNTINLQKVVAESMKELFPDDDIFAEEREKLNGGEKVISYEAAVKTEGDTVIYGRFGNASDSMESDSMESDSMESDSVENDSMEDNSMEDNSMENNPTEDNLIENAFSENNSAKIASTEDIDTPVDKPADLPKTESEALESSDFESGSLSRVILPGDDATPIKVELDMDELRSTTERSVHTEQSRMEDNNENVYLNEPAPEYVPMVGQISMDDVLNEWERIKEVNAKRHEEEIRNQILSQTGQMFDDFDQSVNKEIMAKLDDSSKVLIKGGSIVIKPQDSADDMKIEELGESEPEDISSNESSSNESSLNEKPSGNGQQLPNEIREEMSELEKAVANELGGTTQNIPYSEICATMNTVLLTDLPLKEGYYEEEEKFAKKDEASDFNIEKENLYNEAEDIEVHDTDSLLPSEEEADRNPVAKGGHKLDPEEEEDIVEMAKEDAMKTQEIKMNTADLSSLSEKIVETTNKEAMGEKREEIREFTADEQALFENFAVTKKIKKQIIYALDNMSLAAYTGNVLITGDAGLDTLRMAKNLIKEYQAQDPNFSGRIAKISGEKINSRNIKDIFDKLDNGGIIIEKANGMSERKLYEMASLLNQENLGIVVILEDTKKEITKLLEKQAFVADYFNIRIDLMEMDNNALVAYAKNYALALEYAIDELGTLALYTRIANMQSGNHVVTKDEVRDIIDEAIYKSKKSKIKNFVDVLFARRYDKEDMIVLRERDFM